MVNIILKHIKLTDFRGQSREMDFNPVRTDIKGTNGVGKSTLFEAFHWLLTGFDSLGRANYDLFDNRLDFTPENAIPASVEGVFDVEGFEFKLMRVAKQKWIRPRNSAEYVKDKSDEYHFYIDDLEVSATAYRERVTELFGCDMEKLKLILNVRYFRQLNWKDLRKHIADLVGDVTEADLTGDYREVQDLLAKYGRDGAKEYIRQQILPLKNQEKELVADIKAAYNVMPDLTPVAEAEAGIASRRERIDEINREILGLEDANKPYIEKRKAELAEIEELNTKLKKLMAEHKIEQDAIEADLEKQIRDAQKNNAEIDTARKRRVDAQAKHDRDIRNCKDDIADAQEERERLLAQNNAIKTRVFEGKCPTCCQVFPPEMWAEEQRNFFERNDAERVPIVERGKKVAARIEMLKNRLLTLESEPIEQNPESEEYADVSLLEAKLAEFRANKKLATDDERWKALSEEIESKKASLTVIPEVDSKELTEESKKLVAEIEALAITVAGRKTYNTLQVQIERFQAKKALLGEELASWEKLLTQLVNRDREWADIVRNRANQYLSHVKVEMLDRDKSGNLVDICSVSIDGVDVGVTNTACKVEAGIDLANAFSKAYGITAPLFIDNAEQLADISELCSNRQLITMSVDGEYNELTVL